MLELLITRSGLYLLAISDGRGNRGKKERDHEGITDPKRGNGRHQHYRRTGVRESTVVVAVNANYSERSARIPDSIIEPGNDVGPAMDYRKFDIKLNSAPLRNDPECPDRYRLESWRVRDGENQQRIGFNTRSKQSGTSTWSSTLRYHDKRFKEPVPRDQTTSLVNPGDTILLSGINPVSITLRASCE